MRNVNEILAHLHSEMSDIPYNPDDSQDDLDITTVYRAPRALERLKFTEIHRDLKSRLETLTMVQRALEHMLGTASMELRTADSDDAAPFDVARPNRRALQEFSINSSNGWKSAFDRFRNRRQENGNGNGSSPTGSVGSSAANGGVPRSRRDTEEDIAEAIAACREDIKLLWEDQIVNEMLNRRKVRLEDAPGL